MKRTMLAVLVSMVLVTGCGNSAVDNKSDVHNKESVADTTVTKDRIAIEQVEFADADGNIISKNADGFYELSKEFKVTVKCDDYFSRVMVFFVPSGSSMTEETKLLAVGSNKTDGSEYTVDVDFENEENLGHIYVEVVNEIGIFSQEYNVIVE